MEGLVEAQIQQALDNEDSLAGARARGVQAGLAAQPKNTRRNYKPKQRAWKDFCSKRAFADGDLVYESKVCLWLEEDLFHRVAKPPTPKEERGRRGRRRKRPEEPTTSPPVKEDEDWKTEEDLAQMLGVPLEEVPAMLADDRGDDEPEAVGEDGERPGQPLKPGTLEGYISAIAELYRIQVSDGRNSYPSFRGQALNGLLDSRRRQLDELRRNAFEDRGIGGLTAGYSLKELGVMQARLLEHSVANPLMAFRTRLDVLAGHFCVLRGESRRMLELADLSLLEYPPEEGPTPCFALVLRLSSGKVNKAGRIQFMGAMRHKDPLYCTMGSLAQYLCYRWMIHGEEPPDFRTRESWYPLKLLLGRDPRVQISYPTQLQAIWWAFTIALITAIKKTHAMRGCGAQCAELHGVLDAQIRRAGLWDDSAMAQAYLTGLPLQFLRAVAGFPSQRGSYYLRRAGLTPPDVLLKQLWPWVEGWDERFRARSARKTWARGGLDEDDTAGQEFIRLMKHLRVVLLQDLAVLQPRFPDLLLFRLPLFASPEWAAFAALVVETEGDGSEEPRNVLIQRAIPEVSNALHTITESLSGQMVQLQAATVQRLEQRITAQDARLARFEAALEGLTSGKLRLSLTGSFIQEVESAIDTVDYGIGVPLPAPPPLPTPPSTSSEASPIRAGAAGTAGAAAPAYTLFAARTVADVWMEWDVGIGAPPLRELEDRWGHRWRQKGKTRTAWSRRKVLVNRLLSLQRQGASAAAAVAELEALRGTRSLYALSEELSQL